MIEAFGASGELSGYDFPKLLVYLHDTNFSGKLIITSSNVTKSLFFSNGQIAYSASNDPKDRLGEIMKKHGMLSPEQLENITSKLEAEKKTFGKLVIELGYLTSEDLLQASGLQVKEIVKSLLTEGEFSYFLKKEFLPSDVPDLKINPYQIIYDSLLEFDDLEWIHKQLGSNKRIFQQSEDFVKRYQHLFFLEETDILIAKIDGKANVQEILDATQIEQTRAKKILASLYLLNMLEIVSDSPLDMEPPTIVEKTDTTQEVDAGAIKARASRVPPEAEKATVPFAKMSPSDLEQITAPKSPEAAEKITASGHEIGDGKEVITSEREIQEAMPDLQKLIGRKKGPPPLSRPEPIRTDSVSDDYITMLKKRRRVSGKTMYLLVLIFLIAAGYYVYTNYFEEKPRSRQVKPTKNVTTLTKNIHTKNSQAKPPVRKNISKPPRTTQMNMNRGKTEKNLQSLKSTIQPLMRRGRYREAAKTWRENLKLHSGYTINVEIACSTVSIKKIYGYDSSLNRLFLLPRNIGGKACFRVCWGLFETQKAANNAIRTLPAYYQQQKPTPKPIKLKSIL